MFQEFWRNLFCTHKGKSTWKILHVLSCALIILFRGRVTATCVCMFTFCVCFCNLLLRCLGEISPCVSTSLALNTASSLHYSPCTFISCLLSREPWRTVIVTISLLQGGCKDDDDDVVADTPRCSDYTYVCTDQPVDTCKSQSGLDPIHNYMGCKLCALQWRIL